MIGHKKLIFFVFVITITLVFVASEVPLASLQFVRQISKFRQFDKTKTTETKSIPRCGDIQTARSGGIFYKPLEQVLPNERCVWIISVENALGYNINIQYLSDHTNEPGSGQGLVFMGIAWEDTEPITTNFLMPNLVGEFNISNCNKLVITFFSSDQDDGIKNTGFVLQYEADYAGNASSISPLSVNFLMESPVFDFWYPTDHRGIPYASKELSLYVFPLNNFVYTADSGSTIHYLTHRLEGTTCNDSLFVFKFNAKGEDLTEFWGNGSRICGNTTNVWITHDDLVLFVFQSNAANTNYNGFEFNYRSC